MEFVQGGDLFQIIRNCHRLSQEQTTFYIAEILCGIEYLHKEMGIIYRDMKPENILLTREGHVKLTDFGLSKPIQ